jgi:hypothetical protein
VSGFVALKSIVLNALKVAGIAATAITPKPKNFLLFMFFP